VTETVAQAALLVNAIAEGVKQAKLTNDASPQADTFQGSKKALMSNVTLDAIEIGNEVFQLSDVFWLCELKLTSGFQQGRCLRFPWLVAQDLCRAIPFDC
jgi:hypothetical protein